MIPQGIIFDKNIWEKSASVRKKRVETIFDIRAALKYEHGKTRGERYNVSR